MQLSHLKNRNVQLVYEFVREFIAEHGFAPSQQQIADGCYLSRATIARYLDRLEALGYIIRQPHIARGITLVEDQDRL